MTLLPPLRSLRYCREHALLTQVDLAKASGVSRSTILKLEDGDHAYPISGLKLAQALGVSLDTLQAEPPVKPRTAPVPTRRRLPNRLELLWQDLELYTAEVMGD